MTDESKDTKPESQPEICLRDKGPIEFSVGDKLMLSIKEEGFFVQGRLVDSDRKVYEHFREWLTLALKDVKPAAQGAHYLSDTPTLDEIADVIGKLVGDLKSAALTPRRSDLPEELLTREALLRTFAKTLGSAFSGEGFALFVFDLNTGDGQEGHGHMSYVSNANRADMLRALQEHIERMRQGTDDTAGREPGGI